MIASIEWPDWLVEYRPQLPMTQLVEEVNQLFHAFEAAHYDQRHPEIFVQCPAIWSEMVGAMLAESSTGPWRLLDFGCGTGFVTEQLIEKLPAGAIREVVCYDPSPEMLTRCREKLGKYPECRFTSSLDEVLSLGPYKLIATNSVLHHLPNVAETFERLAQVATPDAYWLAGHEPSRGFYRNPECLAALAAYRAEQRSGRWWRWKRLSPGNWGRIVSKLMPGHRSPKALTAKAAFAKQLFGKQPTGTVIDRIVDLHVAHTQEEAELGRGFDLQQLCQSIESQWHAVWQASYSYMGPIAEVRLPTKWQEVCRQLKATHPTDGAHFSVVLRRAEAASV